MGLPDDVRRLLGSDGGLVSLQLDASTLETLAHGLRELVAGEQGWIMFEDFRRLFEPDKPDLERSRWRVGAAPPGPTWWTANTRPDAWARSFRGGGFEWTWNSPSALALAALANRHRCTPVRSPMEGRFYFTKDEPDGARRR
jgi:hypothetical protein